MVYLILIISLDWCKCVYSDTKYVIASPSRWDKGDWLKCTFIIGTTYGIMNEDAALQEWVQDRWTATSDRISEAIESFGAEGAILALGGVYLTGCITQDTTFKKLALLGAESALISGLIIEVLKIIIGRSRPYKEEGAFSFSWFNLYGESQSLPSGHTGAAFSIASCISEECKNPFVSVIGYTTATLVGLSRIHDNKHWASDVFLGAVIGVSVGKTIARLR